MIRKPAIITAASITGVVIAGGAAIGANVGILGAADNGPIGNLSAEATVASSAPSTTTSIPDPTTVVVAEPTPIAPVPAQTFVVDVAGDIDLATTEAGLELADVRPNPGWAWSVVSETEATIAVRFTAGADTLNFTARLNDDDTIAANVERPSPPAAAAPATPATAAPATYVDDDDRYEDDENEDDDYEEYEEDDDDEDDDEYEGRDDDD